VLSRTMKQASFASSIDQGGGKRHAVSRHMRATLPDGTVDRIEGFATEGDAEGRSKMIRACDFAKSEGRHEQLSNLKSSKSITGHFGINKTDVRVFWDTSAVISVVV